MIDWEGWHPLWDGNWDEKTVYRNLSLDLVRQEHPGWPEDRVEAKARRQFETAARYGVNIFNKKATYWLGYCALLRDPSNLT